MKHKTISLNDGRLTDLQSKKVWDEAIAYIKNLGISSIAYEDFKDYLSMVDIETIIKKYPDNINDLGMTPVDRIKANNLRRLFPEFRELTVMEVFHNPKFHQYTVRGKLK